MAAVLGSGMSNSGRVLRTMIGVIIGVAGLIFLASSMSMVVSNGWAAAEGSVRSCTVHITYTGRSASVEHDCLVIWQADGKSHSGTFAVAPSRAHQGQQIEMRARGDFAAVAKPRWEAYAIMCAAVVLLGAGVLVGFGIRPRKVVRGDSSNLT